MKYTLIVALFFVALYCPGQNKAHRLEANVVYDSTYEVSISPNLPLYFVNFHIYGGITSYGEPACMFLISTFTSSNRTLIDTLRYWRKDFEPNRLREVLKSDNEARPFFLDVNFDGYLDLRMPQGEGMRGDFGFEYFLFIPKEKKYKYSEEFTDACMGAKIDPIKKEIITTSQTERDCGSCYEESKYKVINNHPSLFEVIISEIIQEGTTKKQKITTKRMVNGKLSVVNTEFFDFPY